MALKPIDLSTVYSQMDKMGQLNASQMQGSQEAARENLQRTARELFHKYQNVVEVQKSVPSSKIRTDVSKGEIPLESPAQGENGTRGTSKPTGERASCCELKDPKTGRFIDVKG